MMKKLWVILCLILCVCFTGCKGSEEEWIETGEIQQKTTEEVMPDTGIVEKNEVVVYICGEVVNPGVYTLSEGQRVCDVISLAGGLTKDADSVSINQAMHIEDGQQIYVPDKNELPQEAGGIKADDGRVNINTADLARLQTITGIGESRAVSIIEYREKKWRL